MQFDNLCKLITEEVGEPTKDIRTTLLKMQEKLKKLNHQMYQQGEWARPSLEFEDHLREEVKKYTDFAQAHAMEITAQPELKAIYNSFKNKYYSSI